MDKPAIVLVPGSWHVPAHFSKVQTELETAGYNCVGLEHPSTFEPMKDGKFKTIQDDTAAVRQTVLSQLDENDENAVVIVHSYGSIPGLAALHGLNKQDRQSQGYQRYVKCVIILSGFVLPAGITMKQASGGEMPPQYKYYDDGTNLPMNPPGAIDVLYNDLEPEEAEHAVSLLRPQSSGVLTAPIPDQLAGVKGIPVSYLVCENDNAVPPPVPYQTISSLREAGVEVHGMAAQSGHSPFLKLPKELALFIRNVAGEHDCISGFRELS